MWKVKEKTQHVKNLRALKQLQANETFFKGY